MVAIRTEIFNPKALQLIKVSDEQISTLKAYLKKMRSKAKATPTLDEKTKIVEEVRDI